MKCTIPNNPQAEEVLIGKYNFSSLITFLVSESNDVFAYNIDTEISRPFGVIQTNFYSFGCERVDNDLFVFGKEDMDSSDNSGEDKIFGIDKFSLESRKTKFCYARSYPTNLYSCSAKVNNEIMVFGRNRKDYFDPPSNMTILDIPSMKWRKGPSLPVNISLQSSVVLNNSVYGIGGLSHAALRYDLREGLWTTLPMSIIGLDYSAVCQYNNTDIMKAGGHMPIFNENLRVNFIEANNGCEIFDTRANSWRRTSNLPMPVHNAKCCQIKETVVLFGGKTEEEILQDIHAYNIAEETWTRNDSELCNIEDLHSIHLI
uniref:Kelch domain-containing protein 10 n=1 Tax=Rhabditophanes sp. KR3021 TaxID=114890 RepID=A0AC35TJK0_9BILA